MVSISATEFKNNFGKYMELVKMDDIEITKNGKVVGIFSNPNLRDVESLFGIMKGYVVDKDDIREMRINEKYLSND